MLRNPVRGEDGMTLVELAVAMMVLSIVMLVFSSVFASIERGIVRQNNLSLTLDQGRLALQQLDREIRSGNVLYDPSLENNGQASCSGCQPSYTLRIYTQTNADTRGTYTCTLWKIDSSQQLLTRQWPPSDPDNAGSWRVVATGVVNRTVGTAAFALDSDALKGSRTLNITLSMNNDYSNFPTQTATLQEALTGRNTSYGYPTNVCAATPSG
jgi:prepilin-type N-terminal cleavage/methylation domain-containing protein